MQPEHEVGYIQKFGRQKQICSLLSSKYILNLFVNYMDISNNVKYYHKQRMLHILFYP